MICDKSVMIIAHEVEINHLRQELSIKESEIDGLILALKDSISWHDDTGRFIPGFDTIEEAGLMYGFGQPSTEYLECWMMDRLGSPVAFEHESGLITRTDADYHAGKRTALFIVERRLK